MAHAATLPIVVLVFFDREADCLTCADRGSGR